MYEAQTGNCLVAWQHDDAEGQTAAFVTPELAAYKEHLKNRGEVLLQTSVAGVVLGGCQLLLCLGLSQSHRI